MADQPDEASTTAAVGAEGSPPLPPSGPEHWETMPAVDPWADQDTPWQPAAGVPAPAPTLTPPPVPAPPVPAPPVPAPPVAPQPVAPRQVTRRRRAARPPRRRGRWRRTLLVATLLSVTCCCGVPGYVAWPLVQQYPATAVLPTSVADLRLHDDAAGRRAADRLAEQLLDVNLVADDVFAGVYGDGTGKRVTVFGMTGLRLTPRADLEAEMRHLAGRYQLTGIERFDLDESGAHERCGVGRADGGAVVVCGWADHGSLGTAVLTRRSVSESAGLVGVLREAVVTRG